MVIPANAQFSKPRNVRRHHARHRGVTELPILPDEKRTIREVHRVAIEMVREHEGPLGKLKGLRLAQCRGLSADQLREPERGRQIPPVDCADYSGLGPNSSTALVHFANSSFWNASAPSGVLPKASA